jgi:flagellar biosynthesis protein FlhF
MKIRRFLAGDMRQAIRQVREALGPDAVILSNKSVNGGVEIVAAVDLDQATAVADEQPSRSTAGPTTDSASTNPPAAPAKTAAAPATSGSDAIADMRREMAELKRMMQNGLSELSWQALGERSPVQQELLRRLMTLGLSAEIAQQLAARADGDDIELAWRKALYQLAGELQVFDEDILEQGGVVAVVGPTGVGKTTTIAKLAARFALRHGHRHLALVTTDNFRIGARDQLHTYGRILNVPVHGVAGTEELETTLNSLSDRRLVLIDTAGMGQQDQRLREQIGLLQQAGRKVHCLLALSATTEPMAMERAIRLFADARPEACILTKLDEAASLGGALNALLRSGLPLAYTTDGQQVPEDLHIARAHPLVTRAAELTQEHEVACDPTYLALAYGGSRSNAHA